MNLKDNPVKASGSATGIISTFLASLGIWGLSVLAVPPMVMTSGVAVIVLVAALVGGKIGSWVQQNFTEPKDAVREIAANIDGVTLPDVSKYAKAVAHNDTDHLPEGMEE